MKTMGECRQRQRTTRLRAGKGSHDAKMIKFYSGRTLAMLVIVFIVTSENIASSSAWTIPKILGRLRRIMSPSTPQLPTEEDIEFLSFFNKRVEQETIDWVQSRVIRLNLCPFADRPLNKDKRLTTHLVRGDNPNVIADNVLDVMLQVMNDITENPNIKEGRTALVVTPDFTPDDFEPFLMMVQFLEQVVMTEYQLHGHIQLVPFHPLFKYDYVGDYGSADTGVSTTNTNNGDDDPIEASTNRSPYPMFHVLLEDDVSKATSIALRGDPGKVWRRNALLLRLLEEKLGRTNALKYLMGNNYSTGADEEKDDDGSNAITLMNGQEIHQLLKQTKIDFEKQEAELSDNEKPKTKGGWSR